MTRQSNGSQKHVEAKHTEATETKVKRNGGKGDGNQSKAQGGEGGLENETRNLTPHGSSAREVGLGITFVSADLGAPMFLLKVLPVQGSSLRCRNSTWPAIGYQGGGWGQLPQRPPCDNTETAARGRRVVDDSCLVFPPAICVIAPLLVP